MALGEVTAVTTSVVIIIAGAGRLGEGRGPIMMRTSIPGAQSEVRGVYKISSAILWN